jgi:hypothetical protein
MREVGGQAILPVGTREDAANEKPLKAAQECRPAFRPGTAPRHHLQVATRATEHDLYSAARFAGWVGGHGARNPA